MPNRRQPNARRPIRSMCRCGRPWAMLSQARATALTQESPHVLRGARCAAGFKHRAIGAGRRLPTRGPAQHEQVGARGQGGHNADSTRPRNGGGGRPSGCLYNFQDRPKHATSSALPFDPTLFAKPSGKQASPSAPTPSGRACQAAYAPNITNKTLARRLSRRMRMLNMHVHITRSMARNFFRGATILAAEKRVPQKSALTCGSKFRAPERNVPPSQLLHRQRCLPSSNPSPNSSHAESAYLYTSLADHKNSSG